MTRRAAEVITVTLTGPVNNSAAVARLVDTAARLEMLTGDQTITGATVLAPRYDPWEPLPDGSYPWPNGPDGGIPPRAQEQAFLQAVGESAMLLTVVPPDGKLDRRIVVENAWAALRGTHRVLRRTAYPWRPIVFDGSLTADERRALAELSWETLISGWGEATEFNNWQLRLGLQQQIRDVPRKIPLRNRPVLTKIIDNFLRSLDGG